MSLGHKASVVGASQAIDLLAVVESASQAKGVGKRSQRLGSPAALQQRGAFGDTGADLSLSLFSLDLEFAIEGVAHQPKRYRGNRDRHQRALGRPKSAFEQTKPPNRGPVKKHGQIRVHLARGRIAARRLAVARANQHFIELAKDFGVREGVEGFGQLREIVPVFAGGDLIQHLAEAEQVPLGGAGTFRRDVAFRAHVGSSFSKVRHQTHVGELGRPVDEDDVRHV